MTDQPRLFPPLELNPHEHQPSPEGYQRGVHRRDVGHAVVEAATDEEFRDAAWAAMRRACQAHMAVTSDDIWRELDAHGYDGRVPKRANLVGSIMRRAAGLGWTKDSGQMTKTARAAGNARKITVWRSLLYPR